MVDRKPVDPEHQNWQPDKPEDYCARCGASVGLGGATGAGCAWCLGKNMPWHRLVRLGLYHPPLDERIRAMKFGRQWAYGPFLGQQLAQQIGQPFDPKRIVVTSVPMHWLRRWRRGYNQADLMAGSLAKARGWPLVQTLTRTRYTPPQTRIPASGRARNVRNCFALVGIDLAGYEVVLVDDVKTTGSTLSACARLLRDAGAQSITVAVAAVADPQHTRFMFK